MICLHTSARRSIVVCLVHVAHHSNRTAGAIILRISYGYHVQEGKDQFVDLVEMAMEQFSAAMVTGAFMVDIVPIRTSSIKKVDCANDASFEVKYVPEWVPGAGFQRKAREWRATLHEMVERPHKLVKDQMVGLRWCLYATLTSFQAAGIAPRSYTFDLLDGKTLTEEEEFGVKWSASAMYGGRSSAMFGYCPTL